MCALFFPFLDRLRRRFQLPVRHHERMRQYVNERIARGESQAYTYPRAHAHACEFVSLSRLRPRHVQHRFRKLGMRQYAIVWGSASTTTTTTDPLTSAAPGPRILPPQTALQTPTAPAPPTRRALVRLRSRRRADALLPFLNSNWCWLCVAFTSVGCPAQSTSPAKSAGCTCGAGFYSLAGSGLATVGSPCLGK